MNRRTCTAARHAMSTQWLRLGTTLLVVLLSLNARADTGWPPAPVELAAWIEQEMQRYGTPGASVAVIRDHRIAWAQGFGLSDKEHRTPVTTRTLFQAASTSK
ncbi:MAG TPA: serine hydrolase domain-containing protein, partial [Crenalkalicoccus sp.]|nr:serine hydrolase domain-containing protein [Crenalkalicoccus sp.]